jgi:hypothetical protein
VWQVRCTDDGNLIPALDSLCSLRQTCKFDAGNNFLEVEKIYVFSTTQSIGSCKTDHYKKIDNLICTDGVLTIVKVPICRKIDCDNLTNSTLTCNGDVNKEICTIRANKGYKISFPTKSQTSGSVVHSYREISCQKGLTDTYHAMVTPNSNQYKCYF